MNANRMVFKHFFFFHEIGLNIRIVQRFYGLQSMNIYIVALACENLDWQRSKKYFVVGRIIIFRLWFENTITYPAHPPKFLTIVFIQR